MQILKLSFKKKTIQPNLSKILNIHKDINLVIFLKTIYKYNS